MYPSSSSSSSQSSMRPSGLIRYDSAPGSFLSNAVDSVVGCPPGSHPHHQFLARSNCFPNPTVASSADNSITSESNNPKLRVGIGEGAAVQTMAPPYFLNEISNRGGISFGLRTDGGGPSTTSSNPLVRHSSSPAGFLNQLAASVATTPSCATPNNGFPVVRRSGMAGSSFNSRSGIGESSSSSNKHGISRLNSQVSFTRQKALSLISEDDHDQEHMIRNSATTQITDQSFCTASFGGSNWPEVDSSNINTSSSTIAFSSPNKRPKSSAINVIDSMETQLHFGLTTHDQGAALEMNAMEKLLHMQNIPQDSVPCKLRAKRGFATHPRSIAERERRTRISGKLKKLQELVPNMDKQTSYADMLDLAVQQIKGLQNQVQKLENEMENCTCGCSKQIEGTSKS